MGWKRSTLLLEFVGDEFDGLEVRTKRFVIDDLLLLDSWYGTPGTELLEQVTEMLAERIISWNFEDEHDQPVEISPKGLRSHVDGPFFRELIAAVRRASSGVAAPLETPSNDGELEQSIPMEPLENPAS